MLPRSDVPPPTYPQYTELWAAAQRAVRGPIDPASIPRTERIAADRGWDWCAAVLGHHYHGLPYVSVAEAELLVLAHQADVDPPLPDWIVADRAAAAAHQARRDAERAAQRAHRRAGDLPKLPGVHPDHPPRPDDGRNRHMVTQPALLAPPSISHADAWQLIHARVAADRGPAANALRAVLLVHVTQPAPTDGPDPNCGHCRGTGIGVDGDHRGEHCHCACEVCWCGDALCGGPCETLAAMLDEVLGGVPAGAVDIARTVARAPAGSRGGWAFQTAGSVDVHRMANADEAHAHARAGRAAEATGRPVYLFTTIAGGLRLVATITPAPQEG